MMDKKIWNKILILITIINFSVCLTTAICINIYQTEKSKRLKSFIDSDLFIFYSRHYLNDYTDYTDYSE